MGFECKEWVPFSWYCPNCGAKVTGYKNKDGDVKVTCGRCHTAMVRKIKNKSHNTLELYVPKGQAVLAS